MSRSLRPSPMWYPHARVGATMWGNYKALSDAQEQLAVDMDLPIAKQWVELKRQIIAIADELGIGAEIATMFDVLKAGAVVSYVAPAGTAGAAAALGISAGVAAGVIGGLVIAVFSILDDDEDETAAAQARKEKLRAAIWRILLPPTLASLAADQDQAAKNADAAVSVITQLKLPIDPAPVAKRAALARKLAAFYRLASTTLSSSEEKLFVSAAYLARLLAFKQYVDQLSVAGTVKAFTMRTRILVAVPLLDKELAQRIAAAQAEFKTAAKQPTTPRRASGPFFPLLFVGAGALAIAKPEMARNAAGQVGTLLKMLYSKVRT